MLPDILPEIGKKKLILPFKQKFEISNAGAEQFFLYLPDVAVRQMDGEYIVTHPTDKKRPEGSQLWHRDNTNHPWAYRLFIYLDDVTLDNGPFCYAPGTQKGGWRYSGDCTRLSDDDFAKVIPRDQWVTFTAPKGTIIIANLTGYHKGLMNVSGSRRTICYSYYGKRYG